MSCSVSCIVPQSGSGICHPAGGDCLVQHQPALLICNPAASLHELDHLVWRFKVQLPGQGSLQILLQKPALPAVAVLEVHVTLMETLPKADFPFLIESRGVSGSDFKSNLN